MTGCESTMRLWPGLLKATVVSVMVSGCASATSDVGLIRRVTDNLWRVEVRADDAVPRLKIWSGTASEPFAENKLLLPPDLLKAQADWRLLKLDLRQGFLSIGLQYRPSPGVDSYQTKIFEFNLNAPGQPLAQYRVTTGRSGRVDWQTVDFVRRQSFFCRNAAESNPDDCKAVLAELTDEQAPTFRGIGSAEDYVPPIKMEIRY